MLLLTATPIIKSGFSAMCPPGPGKRRFPPTERYCEPVSYALLSVQTDSEEESMVVCVCNAIREKDVRAAVRSGASCPSSAYARAGHRPKCGQCFPFAREIIASEQRSEEHTYELQSLMRISY